MLSISDISGRGHGQYYIELAREDYYLEGGEPPGKWLGKGAAELELNGAVEAESFKHVFAGYSQDGSVKLVQNAGEESRDHGWDLTFSAPKSVSTYWSQADQQTRREIQQVQQGAVERAIDYLEENASITRRGKGGAIKEKAGLVVATYEHGTSRAHDPQLHTHALVVNVCTRADGSSGTIESLPLYQHKMAAGAVYRAELAAGLERQLGLQVERKKSWFELSGVSEKLTQEFSKRREAIEKALEEKGYQSARASEVAAVDTRETKSAHIAREKLFDEWQKTGLEHGWSRAQAEDLLRQSPKRDFVKEQAKIPEITLMRVTERQSHFAERDLVKEIAIECQGRGLGAAEVKELTRETLTSSEVVNLGIHKGEQRFSTCEMLELERGMLSLVERTRQGVYQPVSDKTLEEALKSRPSVSEEQKNAIRHITKHEGQVQLVSGMAGTGKTFMLEAARDVWEREGYQVIGAALSGKAAQGLEEGAGIKSNTIHKTLKDLEGGGDRGVQLDKKTILVIDEAGMVGTRQMARVVAEVEQRGAKLVLVGDARQLQAIDAGGPFQAIANRVGQSELKEIRRQREGWARDAVHSFARGDAGNALRAYAERGLVSVSEDRKGALRALIEDWKGQGAKTPEEHLILSGTNAEVKELNKLAQVERRALGELGPESVTVGGQRLHQGDRVVFTRNSKLFGVKNGSLGTIERINEKAQSFRARLDDGLRVSIDLRHYEYVRPGYAVTTHKAQGVTVNNVYLLTGGSMQDRELSYVQASRAKDKTRIYTDKLSAGDNLTALSKQMSKSRQKDLAVDVIEKPQLVQKLSLSLKR